MLHSTTTAPRSSPGSHCLRMAWSHASASAFSLVMKTYLPLSSFSPDALALEPLVTADLHLPTRAHLHSVAIDPSAGSIFALHDDGWLLLWSTRHGELRHSAPLLTKEEAARLPSGSVLTADPASGLYLFNATWLDSTVHVLEPLAADTVTTVRVMAAEAERHDSASELLYLHEMQLLLVGTPGDAKIRGYGTDAALGELSGEFAEPVVVLSGHEGAAPPVVRALSALGLTATGGADGTICLWRVTESAAGGGGGGGADGGGWDASCEAVLRGHSGPVVDVAWLPAAKLIATVADDKSVRFWDPTATPLPLVAPDNGAHVRYGFGDFRPARPEWTRSNPAFVNCLTLHLTQTPLAIAPVSDWSGPEAVLVHATAGGARGGSLQLWSVTRSAVSVPACRFDEPLPPADYAAREQADASTWRDALGGLSDWNASLSATKIAERRLQTATRGKADGAICRASVLRSTVEAPLDATRLKEARSRRISRRIMTVEPRLGIELRPLSLGDSSGELGVRPRCGRGGGRRVVSAAPAMLRLLS